MHEIPLRLVELDIQRNRKCDLTKSTVRQKWMQRISRRGFFALLLTPPCSTFSRAVWANDQGPYPVRSHTFSRGFPWNSTARKQKAELGNSLADFIFEAFEQQVKEEPGLALIENPENLGKTRKERVPGHWPGSMWLWDQHAQLAGLNGVETVAFHQGEFGAPTPKPTRFLMKMDGETHQAFQKGMPKFSSEGWYEGPLERGELPQGEQLIGQQDGAFRTAASAAWPPKLCEWTAKSIVASFLRNRARARRNGNNVQREEQKEESKEEEEIDALEPPWKGGEGPARACEWKGGSTPCHDGGCLCSPGRWPLGRRRYPQGRWQELRRKVEEKILLEAGGEAALQKECFRMTKGENGCSLVKNEKLLKELREVMVEFVGKDEVVGEVAPGQPFRLRLMGRLLEEAGDPDAEFLRQAEEGLPLGILEKLPRTRALFERQTRWALEDDPSVEAELYRSNYPSAEEHEEHLRGHLEKEVEEGLIVKMKRKGFEEKFQENRAVASLAVLVEDEMTGKKRVLHDATHGVRVNNRI